MASIASIVRGLAVISFLSLPAHAGPLDPPAGPITPTQKPLGEIEPRTVINATNTPGDATNTFIISQPGSYYVTGAIDQPAANTAIRVTATGPVSIDLNGFEIRQQIVSTVSGDSPLRVENGAVVRVAAATRPLIARDLTINQSIVSTLTSLIGGPRSIVERIAVNTPSGSSDGISCGENSAIRDCIVVCSPNASNAIVAGGGSVVERCTTRGARQGFIAGSGVTFRDCAATLYEDFGYFVQVNNVLIGCVATNSGTDGNFDLAQGFSVQAGSTLERCVSSENDGPGFAINGRVTLDGCIATANTTDGFVITSPGTPDIAAVLRGCVATNNGLDGSSIGAGFRIEGARGTRLNDCIAEANDHGLLASAFDDLTEISVTNSTFRNNSLTGITSEASTSIIDCQISNNSGTGIDILSSSTIRGCTINSNTGSGIRASLGNLIQNNMISSNATGAAGAGNAGILCTSGDNRIDGNTLIANQQDGIRLNASGNLVIRNTLANTGASINAVAGNRVAQTIANPASGFVSTDPNANYIY